MPRSLLFAFLSLFLLTAFAPAQEKALKPSGPTIQVPDQILTPGQTIQIQYSNPSKPGQTVAVQVDDPSRRGVSQVVLIQLDSNGNGVGEWVVENWVGANFNAPGAAEVFRPIR